ncbi:signal peptide peptidase SppA [Helicobacter sp. T3_23-1056]
MWIFNKVFRPIGRAMGKAIIGALDFITKYFKTFVFLFIVALIIIPKGEPMQIPNLAKIELKGAILDANAIRKQIEQINKYPTIKGVLLVIDSPGGAVGASVEIADLIKDLNAKIPVVAHAQGTMASGAYYAGAYSRKIYANRGSLVGSIGVIFAGGNIEELLGKIGYKPSVLKAGEYKEIGVPYRAWSEKEREFLQNLINEEYDTFVSDMVEARGLKREDSAKFAEGKIFTAKSALELGLIDALGSQQNAIDELKALSQVKQERWLQKDKFESFMESLAQSSASIVLGTIFEGFGGLSLR